MGYSTISSMYQSSFSKSHSQANEAMLLQVSHPGTRFVIVPGSVHCFQEGISMKVLSLPRRILYPSMRLRVQIKENNRLWKLGSEMVFAKF